MPTSKPASILLLAADSKNTALAEMAGSLHVLAYSPYGQQSSRQEAMTRLGFNGELREAEIDGYFLGNGYRVYNPRLMRFHSPDNMSPFGKGGLNAYGYCGGEPMMRVDPTGHIWKLVSKKITFVLDFFSSNPSAGLKTDLDLPRLQSNSNNEGLWGVAKAGISNSSASTPQRYTPLGRSRSHRSSRPVRETPDFSFNNNTAASSRPATVSRLLSSNALPNRGRSLFSRIKHVITRNSVTTVSTRDGLTITSRDSGRYSRPGPSNFSSTESAGIRKGR